MCYIHNNNGHVISPGECSHVMVSIACPKKPGRLSTSVDTMTLVAALIPTGPNSIYNLIHTSTFVNSQEKFVGKSTGDKTRVSQKQRRCVVFHEIVKS